MHYLPGIGAELDVQFRASTGRRKLLATKAGAKFIHLASAWPEKPKPGEWWRVRIVEKLDCQEPIFMVAPVGKRPTPELPANGLQLGDEVEVTFERSHSGDPFARVERGTVLQFVFLDKTRWRILPPPGERWKVRVLSCSDPTKGIFHVEPVHRHVDLTRLRPNDTVAVNWRNHPQRGVVGTIEGCDIAVRLDSRGGKWQNYVPLSGSRWKVRLLLYLHRDSVWVVDVLDYLGGPKAPKTEQAGVGHFIVTFFANYPERPHAFFNGIRLIPDRRWTATICHGETWLVSEVHRSDKVTFVTGIRRVDARS